MDRLQMLRAVDGRILFNTDAAGLPREQTQELLCRLNFIIVTEDPTRMLRFYANEHMGEAKYRRGADIEQAPLEVDCSSFIQWLYGRIGIELPRRSIQQYDFGEPVSGFHVGDLVFKSGRKNYFDKDRPEWRIGHVGIITEVEGMEGTVIHAVDGDGITLESLARFVNSSGFRGARHIVENLEKWLVLDIPPGLRRRIKTADDVKWLVLTNSINML